MLAISSRLGYKIPRATATASRDGGRCVGIGVGVGACGPATEQNEIQFSLVRPGGSLSVEIRESKRGRHLFR